MHPRFVWGAALALAIILLSACAPGPQPTTPPPGDELRLALATSFDTLDPAQADTPGDHTLHAMVYEGLVAFGPGLRPVPVLADSLPVSSSDGLTWTVHCRQDVTFHDGSVFMCADAQARLQALLDDPAVLDQTDIDPATLRTLLQHISNLALLDDYTLLVELATPFAFFNEALAHPATAIGRGEVGTGPFRLDRLTRDRARFSAYEHYWRGVPQVERVTLTYVPADRERLADLGVEFDAVDQVSFEAGAPNEDFVLLTAPSAEVYVLAVNLHRDPTTDPLIRLAVLTAIDASALASEIYGAHARPAPLFVTPAMEGYSALPVVEPDPIRARELQANAGYPDGFDAALNLDPTLIEANVLAAALRDQLEAIYVRGSVETLDLPLAQLFTADRPGSYLALTARTSPDLYSLLAWLIGELGVDDAPLRQAFTEAVRARTQHQRALALEDVRQRLVETAPAVSLVSPDLLGIVSKDVVGLRFSPFGYLIVDEFTGFQEQ